MIGGPVLPPADARADDRVLRESEVAALRGALLELPEVERAVLALRYFEELAQRDVAAVLGMTAGRVSQIESRAIARLRRRLKRRL